MMNVISVSGASGVGKSVICEKIKTFGNEYGLDVDIICLDSFMYNRQERDSMKIHHGYSVKTFHLDQLLTTLDDLILKKKDVYVREYDHSTGHHQKEERKISPSNFIIIDSSISMIDSIMEKYNCKGLFVDVDLDLIEKMKHETDKRRGYDMKNIERDIKYYKDGYLEFCQPQIKNADYIIKLIEIGDSRKYELIKPEKQNE